MQREVPEEALSSVDAASVARVAEPSSLAAIVAALVAECLGLAATLAFAQSRLWLILLLHAAVVALLAWHVSQCRRSGSDTTMAMLACLAVAAIGPAGALGALTVALLGRRYRADNLLLQRWYDRISLSIAVDPVTRFCDDVGSGRMINLGAPSPPSYPTTIESGNLADRQTVLGNIARRFHPDYLPVLSAALRSPEPVIRVQAAAVAAHIRPEIGRFYRTAIVDLETATGTARDSLRLLHRFEQLVASGLLDEGDRRQGLDVIERLGDVVLALTAGGGLPMPPELPLEVRAGLEDTYDRLLLRRRRFSELRAARSTRRVLEARPRANVRRLAQGAVQRTRLGA